MPTQLKVCSGKDSEIRISDLRSLINGRELIYADKAKPSQGIIHGPKVNTLLKKFCLSPCF